MPKAAVTLHGRTILEHSLDAINGARGEGAINDPLRCGVVVLVLPEDPQTFEYLAAAGHRAAARLGIEVILTSGGANRAASVAAGVKRLAEYARSAGWDPQQVTVLIHDAARPLTPATVFARVAAHVEAGHPAVVPGLPVTDTIKHVRPAGEAEPVLSTPARAGLRAVQTPQGFRLTVLQQVLEYLAGLPDSQAERLTDEAMIAEDLGLDVVVVEGHPQALKITTGADLSLAERILAERTAEARGQQRPTETSLTAGSDITPAARPPAEEVMPAIRVGIGHDVHAFDDAGSPRPLWLAGLLWPGERGLSGHSDGDAVAHAACDALFSAAGLGDLGAHFGTDRPELAGASGVRLLSEAVGIIHQAGYQISNIAVQFVGSRPKFAPRRHEAQQVLSEAAGAPVSVAATTSDGLGFTGRDEGILATATAVIVPVAFGRAG